jgi:hypothetical protein
MFMLKEIEMETLDAMADHIWNTKVSWREQLDDQDDNFIIKEFLAVSMLKGNRGAGNPVFHQDAQKFKALSSALLYFGRLWALTQLIRSSQHTSEDDR